MTKASFGALLETYDTTFVIIGVVVLGLLALFSRLKSKLDVPGPGLREYLPGGLVNPIYKDPRTLTRTLDVLSREYGDVFQVRLGPKPTLVTAVPEDIVHVFSSIDLFPRAPSLRATFAAASPGGILTMERELHKATRKTLRESFNYSMLESFHPHMIEAVNELCETLASYADQESQTQDPKVVDIAEELSVTTFRVLTNVAFGMGLTRAERLQIGEVVNLFMDELMKDFMGYPIRQALTPLGVRNKQIECQGKLRKVCQAIIKQKLEETKKEKEARHVDVLDTILSLENIETDSAASMTVEFATAGSHTTNQSLVWCIFEVCRNPHVARRIDEELSLHLGDRPLSDPVTPEDLKKLSYFTSIWTETLRIHHVGAGVLRDVQDDVMLRGSGTWVPKGTLIMTHIARAQTNERIWKDPLSFKPERWEAESGHSEGEQVPAGSYVPFGVGPKACVGRFLADYEGPLILIELYRRFRFRLACEPHEVVCCSCFVDTAKTSTRVGGPLDRGLPTVVTWK